MGEGSRMLKWVNRSHISFVLMLGSILWFFFAQMIWKFGAGKEKFERVDGNYFISHFSDSMSYFIYYLSKDNPNEANSLILLTTLGLLFFCGSIYFLISAFIRNQGTMITMALTIALGLSHILYFILLFAFQIDPLDIYERSSCIGTYPPGWKPQHPLFMC